MKKHVVVGSLFLLATACTSKKDVASYDGGSQFSPDPTLEADLKRIDQYVDFEEKNPSILQEHKRAPAATPFFPGTPEGNFQPQQQQPGDPSLGHSQGAGLQPLNSQGGVPPLGKDNAQWAGQRATMEDYARCDPGLDRMYFGSYYRRDPYGRWYPYNASVAEALTSLTLQSGSVTGAYDVDARMVAITLGDNAYPGGWLEQASRANTIFRAPFDLTQLRKTDTTTLAVSVILTSLKRTAGQWECQRQVIDRARSALQSRGDVPLDEIDRQLRAAYSETMRRRPQDIYSDMSRRRGEVVGKLNRVRKYREKEQRELVTQLKESLRNSKTCRRELKQLEATGQVELAKDTNEALGFLRDSVEHCLELVDIRLNAARRDGDKRDYEREEYLLHEKRKLKHSETLLKRISENTIPEGGWVESDEERLTGQLREIDAKLISYYFFLGFKS